MFEIVSVDEAIKKGIYTVNLPALLIFSFGLIVSFTLAFVFIMPFAMMWAIICAIIIAISYRGFMAPKWRIWAFENVRNVHELQQRAISSKLLTTENKPGFGIIDLSSAAQKERWEKLQIKFKLPDIFIDDPAVPPETVIRYSKLKKLAWGLLYVFMFCFGIFLFTLGEGVGPYIFGAMLILAGGGMLYLNIKDVLNRKPQIIINDKGITTDTTRFYAWNDISNEKAIIQGSGKYATRYLCYDHPNGSTKFTLDDFDVSFGMLKKLLRVYRGRSEHGITINHKVIN